MSKLVIKAANGSVEDFPVEAPLEWTILELKRHLFKNYPSKPEVMFQKLVCGGKLLQDGTKVTEVVSSASSGTAVPSGDPLVVHLVVYDRSMSAPVVSPSTSRTAQSSRDLNSSSSNRTSQNGGERERGSASTVSPPSSNNESSIGDHGGLRFRMGVPHNPNVQNIPMPGGGAYPYPMAPPPQFYMSPYGQMYANQFQQWYNAYYRPREAAVGEADEGGVGGGEPNPLDLPGNGNGRNNEAPDGEDADEVNAPGGVGMMAGGVGGGGLRQRDMVDYLYMFMMISFLIFVAYVTNSLGRLLIFTGGVIFMLLNQGGFFALQRRRVAVHEEDLVAPGPQQHDRGHDDQPRPLDQQEQVDHADERGDQDVQVHGDEQQVEGSDNSSARSGSQQAQDPSGNSSSNTQVAPQGPGILATIYIFITTFFTSLVPQQRPELQLN